MSRNAMAHAAEFKVRKAIASDLPAIVDLWWELSRISEALSVHPYLKHEDECKRRCLENYGRSLLWDDYAYFIAEREQRLVGYITANVRNAPEKSRYLRKAVLENVVVEEAYRRKGVCKLMYAAFENWARSRNAEYIEVGTEFRNTVAIDTYRSLGFKENIVELQKWL